MTARRICALADSVPRVSGEVLSGDDVGPGLCARSRFLENNTSAVCTGKNEEETHRVIAIPQQLVSVLERLGTWWGRERQQELESIRQPLRLWVISALLRLQSLDPTHP